MMTLNGNEEKKLYIMDVKIIYGVCKSIYITKDY